MSIISLEKPIKKKREDRKAILEDHEFHGCLIEPETVQTAILLLECEEAEILCRSLRAITKFASQDIANRQVLFNLNAIKHILPHIDHKELNIKRFALKALAQLSQLPHGPEKVLENTTVLKRIAVQFSRTEDVFVHEFSSLVLAELTKEPLGCEQLVAANILDSLFSRIKKSSDPDIQKNCLQTLSHVLADPVCASEVTKSDHIDWSPLLKLMQSKYNAIANVAVTTMTQLVSRFKDAVIQKSFKASTGISEMCEVLGCEEKREVHSRIFTVLNNFVRTEENAEYLYQCGCLLCLLIYLDKALPNLKSQCLAVLTKMTCTVNGRAALYETCTDMVFCQLLLTRNMELLADAALGIANMTKMLPSVIRMVEANIIDPLCVIVADEVPPWFNIRINALRALAELGGKNPMAAHALVDPKNLIIIRNINRKLNTPIEAQRMAVQLYLNLLHYHESMTAMLNADFIGELISVLQKPDIKIKIVTINLLIAFMEEDLGQYLFTLRKGEEVVSENLRIENVGLRTALCNLIMTSVSNEGAEIYLALGTIDFMVENKQARYTVHSWEPALEEIFRHHPSAKFGFMYQLDISDFTVDGFYVQKRPGEHFPTMAELKQQSNPLQQRRPVYVVMFQPLPRTSSISSADVAVQTPQRRSQSTLNVQVSVESRPSFIRPPDDLNLQDYIARLKLWIGQPEKSIHHNDEKVSYGDKCQEVSSAIKQRAKLLGEYVCEQMCGLTQERDCSVTSVNWHLTDLMATLKSHIIGLGWIRVGGTLERALLYKVLADRIGLPCALYRSKDHAWCEVAVPEVAPEDYDRDERHALGLLRGNFVVDLMVQPGRLYPKGSSEARRVCGPTCSPLYVSRCPPQVCACDHGEGRGDGIDNIFIL